MERTLPVHVHHRSKRCHLVDRERISRVVHDEFSTMATEDAVAARAAARAKANPISCLRAVWHRAKSKSKRDAIDLVPWRHNIQVYVANLIADTGGCFDLHKTPNGRVQCHCMNAIVLDDEERVASVDYLIMFATLGKSEQEAIVLEWMRYSKMTPGKGSRCFFFPGSTTHKICRNALAKVIGYGERSW